MGDKIRRLRRFLRWFWQLSQGYFRSKERWGALGLLALLIAMTAGVQPLGLQTNIYAAQVTTALSEKDFSAYQRALLTSTGLTAALILSALAKSFVQQKFTLYWRQWLTDSFLGRYFANRSFYHINGDKEIDNPDQRISQDINSFIDKTLDYFLGLGSNLLGGFLYIGTLWGINRSLVLIAIGTALLQTLVAYFIGRILTPLNFQSLEYEADFRYGLVHVRNHSEAIAFYEGEAQERAEVGARFNRLLKVLHAKILPSSALSSIQLALSITTRLICTLLLAPSYFNGQVSLGDFQLSIAAFSAVVGVFNWFSSNFNSLTQYAAVLKRLGSLADYFDAQAKPAPVSAQIQTIVEPRLSWSRLTVKTPDQARTLIQDLSAEVPPGEGLLIMGPSGAGKSSLLRAVAGLWENGAGYLYRPPIDAILFIPQRPYLVLGSLRRQILYPHRQGDYSEASLQAVLEAVNLGDLIERVGGLDAELDWADVLSLGEQQRLAFARLFLQSPRYAVLDEATSALDVANERLLYQKLQESEITYLSVGHRPTLIPFHEQVLDILGGGQWRLRPAQSS
ncbi:MAG: ATP-binding cassette domain-containing protein [Cyanobacteria bacterium RI_101]|nr:ATP-binding cassette domain-containing protein [Cyanobacteria bacterium RI_101]